MGDVADAADRRRAIETTGPLDVLVNNAGIGEGGWDDMLAVNLTGAHELCVLAAAGLAERRGAIVNVASVAALVAGPGDPQYAVSKAGLVMLTKSLAVTLGPRGVRANAICPGLGANADGRRRDGRARRQTRTRPTGGRRSTSPSAGRRCPARSPRRPSSWPPPRRATSRARC